MAANVDVDPLVSRRSVLGLIGKTVGGMATHHEMTTLHFAAPSRYQGPVDLQGAPKGTSVIILGAGMAGLVAADELRKAGDAVKVLEYNERAGGHEWTLRGGDEYTALGGAIQRCELERGLDFDPGPWRIPHHHHGVLDDAHRFGVVLEPFMQVNYNAYLHSTQAFGDVPQRFRHVQADFNGHVAELLGKAVNRDGLDAPATRERGDRLIEALREWSGLDGAARATQGRRPSLRRGYDVSPGGGPMPAPVPSTPLRFDERVAAVANHVSTHFGNRSAEPVSAANVRALR